MLGIYVTSLEDIYIFIFTLFFFNNEFKVTYLNVAGKYNLEIGKRVGKGT